MLNNLSLSIVIPTYGRDSVLCNSIDYLLNLTVRADEIIIVDQTVKHDLESTEKLKNWHNKGLINWIKKETPSISKSMNDGVLASSSELVLFLDDDIIPDDDLIQSHIQTHCNKPNIKAVVGQVLQPENWKNENNHLEPISWNSTPLLKLNSDLNFPFFSGLSCRVNNVMAGNLSVRKSAFIDVGGFDGRYTPPVSYRFETEFAHRLINAGGEIWFEGKASIKHLRASSGGTRSAGSHLKSMSPIHGVGDYYYALRCGNGLDKLTYILKRPFREIRTKFHLRHPWYIPVKFIGELRALILAFKWTRLGPKYLTGALK